MVTCQGCDHERIADDGLCPCRLGADDGLPLRCVGPWSRDKLFSVERYLEASQTAMRSRWPNRNYVDLFSGPGKCFDRENGVELEGSPLISLAIKHPFTNYHFVDRNPKCIEALRSRCESCNTGSSLLYYSCDCNEAVGKIIQDLPSQGLTIAFVDPTGLDVKLDTLRQLATSRGADLVINFPFYTAVKRNLERFVELNECKLDAWMGSKKWRDVYSSNQHSGETKAKQALLDFYISQLHAIGYPHVDLDYVSPIRAGSTPLYFLILASKNSLGVSIWQGVNSKSSSGQRRLL